MRPEENPIHPAQITQINNAYLLLRHGETDFNAKKLFPGSLDVELNANGRNQARSVRLPRTPNRIIASDLSRAIETAQEVITSHQLPQKLEIDTRLKEKHGGIAEGMLIQEIREIYPDIWDAWNLQDAMEVAKKSKFPNGESDIDVLLRLKSLVEEIENQVSGQLVLLVTHGGVLRVMRLLMNLPKEAIYPGKHIQNCSIEIYEPTGDGGISYE